LPSRFPLAEVGPAVCGQAAHGVDPAPLEQVHADPARHQAVAQQDVSGAGHVPQLAQQADFPLALARVAADAQVEDRTTRERDDGPDTGGGEARPGDLVVGQRVLRAVRRRVRHGDRRAVEQADAAALPEPPRVNLCVQAPPHEAGHGGEEPLGQALPRLAIGAGLGAARLEPLRDAVGDQPGDRGAAGLVGVEHLAEEDPEGHQRGEDPVVPGRPDLAEGLVEAAGVEDVGEGELAVLEELLPEGVDPLAETAGGGAPHRSGSRLEKEYTCPIRARTPISSYPNRRPLFAKIYVPFVDHTEGGWQLGPDRNI
jgi:hypothetical protein